MPSWEKKTWPGPFDNNGRRAHTHLLHTAVHISTATVVRTDGSTLRVPRHHLQEIFFSRSATRVTVGKGVGWSRPRRQWWFVFIRCGHHTAFTTEVYTWDLFGTGSALLHTVRHVQNRRAQGTAAATQCLSYLFDLPQTRSSSLLNPSIYVKRPLWSNMILQRRIFDRW